MADIKIDGMDALIRKLGTIENVQDALEAPMQRATLRIQAKMAAYPPQRPGSTYRRTGTYGRRWVAPRPVRIPGGLQGKVGNNTVYAPLVGSKKFQASIHRGRWPTDEDVLQQELPAIQRDFDQTVQRELNK